MKHFIFSLALILAPLAAVADIVSTPAAQLSVTFDHPEQGGEYFVEVKHLSGQWSEVAKGPASPISFTAPATPGEYTIRAWFRPAQGENAGPSNEASVQFPFSAPINLRVTVTTTVEVVVAPPSAAAKAK